MSPVTLRSVRALDAPPKPLQRILLDTNLTSCLEFLHHFEMNKSQGINTHDFFSKHLRSLCPITATCSSHQHPALSTHGGAVPGGKRDLVVTHEQFRVWMFRMFLYVFLFAEKEAWIEFRILCHTQCCTDSVVAL